MKASLALALWWVSWSFCPPLAMGQGLLEKALKGQARIVDLSYRLNNRTQYWPGPQYKPFRFHVLARLDKDGVYSAEFCTPEHLGTHIDAPNHFAKGQISVAEIPLRRLIAPAVVINVKAKCQKNPDYQLTVGDIRRWERRWGRIPKGAVVFMYTGWGKRYWNTQAYQNRDQKGVLHFPGFSLEAARFLIQRRRVVGLGIDTLSVDYGPSQDFAVHRFSHKAGCYHIEHTANLDQLPPRGAILVVAPLKIENGSGSPARVFAFVP